ncbi:PREDICTED: uncharacterized protein LOC109240145 [Nicotiana attenuata]|uniref:Uncharacterized protein n=1 Tax=Nicotiana attenuata TaxID=49451 RepID=A0A314L8J6_NICAT|nr:PREDICTED: uncharacterized protein LOC109240145 [Nicotiana attenuata]OIT37888.1 hypothetical protein A4A49_00521 [Nicotiana attenuata]
MSAYSHTLNLWGVLSQSKRIINAHSRHFLALSVSFLLPLSFSLIVYPTLQTALSQSDSIIFHPQAHLSSSFLTLPNPFDPTRDLTRPDPNLLLVLLAYTLFAVLLAIFAVATITYSTFHGFYGRPVKLLSSMQSVLYSFLPLVATLIVSRVIHALIVLLFALFGAIAVQCVQLLGFEVNYDSNYFAGLAILLGAAFVLVFIWLQVNWSLAYVIVVVESKWGYEPLRRSAYLVKGMRRVALSVLLFFGVLIGLLVGGCSSFLVTVGAASGGWTSFGVILQMVVSSGFATLLMLQSLAASVVLYMYCKALHGELALDIAEEFASEYVYLPFDNEKVPHVVCVVQG